MNEASCKSIARIVSQNDGNLISASAARISTTKGNALEILAREKTPEENNQLIERVLASGHQSCIEHSVLTVAFCNVSAVVEQFLIEFRLLSFTIKSRRYVDYSKMGYYVPGGLTQEQEAHYREHMDFLFAEYAFLIESGVPKEDARFLLPYSFFSNIYCTINARELVHMVREMRTGRGRGNAELAGLADQLADQLAERMPGVAGELEKRPADQGESLALVAIQEGGSDWAVELLAHPGGLAGLAAGYCVSRGLPLSEADAILADGKRLDAILRQLVATDRARELEQLNYSFLIKGISLSGLTHLARHRMQSLIVPPLGCVNIERYLIPETIRQDTALLERYENAFARGRAAHQRAGELGFAEDQKLYFLLSGNLVDVMTTMNARQLRLFIRLRSCYRAQWEIREISNRIHELAKGATPELFRYYGPSCVVNGHCPEGRMSCGRGAELRRTMLGE